MVLLSKDALVILGQSEDSAARVWWCDIEEAFVMPQRRNLVLGNALLASEAEPPELGHIGREGLR